MSAVRLPFRGDHLLEPCSLVIFGVTGDLTHRKLVPALYDLSCHNVLPRDFTVVGFGRKPLTDADLRELMQRAVDQIGGDGGPYAGRDENVVSH